MRGARIDKDTALAVELKNQVIAEVVGVEHLTQQLVLIHVFQRLNRQPLGVETEAKRVLDNLKAVLEGSGSNFSKVVMTTIFLTDISNSRLVNEIYKEYVSANFPPARQTVAVKDLPLGAQVEISVIASQ